MNTSTTILTKEPRKTYPSCLPAIGYVEMFLCIPADGKTESSWQVLIKPTRGIIPTPLGVIDNIRILLCTQLDTYDYECELPKDVLESMLTQIDTPKFYRYIKSKMEQRDEKN